jgi:hypothetical protein
MNSTDPNINGILASIRILLITIGGVMAGDGLTNTTAYHWVMIGAGSIMVVGPAIWGVYSSFVNFRRARAVGVQAGINMAVQGKALASDGSVISHFGPDATPSKDVTLKSSDEIITKFGPVASTIAKV